LTKRKVSLFLVLTLVVLAFAGCGGNTPAEETTSESTEATTEATEATETASDVEQTLVWNLGSDPKTIDPGLNAASDGGHVTNNTFEGLMREIDGKLEPAMAESYTMSGDGLVYTFTIREGVKWSDGQPVTANDFEYAWSRVADPATASEYAWIFDEVNVASWKAVDERTFEVTLSAPTPYFVGLTAFYTFFPVRQDMVETAGEGAWATNPETAVSNGPFKVTSFKTGDRIVLEPNEHYWRRDEVKLNKIEALMIVDQATALTGYESGQIQILDDMPSAEIPRLLAEDPTFMILPNDAVYYYSFNTKVEPMNDVRVRKALSLAIDRTAIVETVTKAGQIPAHSLIPGGHLDAEGNVFNEMSGTYDIATTAKAEEAQALLEEAGYPNGEGFPALEVMYNTGEGHKNIAEAIQEMWKQNLGIDVTLTNQEWAVFQTSRIEHNFQIARAGWIGDYSDPMTYLGMFTSGGTNNYSQWDSEEFDALLEASKTASGQERFDILYKADKVLGESYAVMPIYYYTDPQMVSDTVAGWEKTTRSTFYFGRAQMIAAE
jgi:oligopeptide transport system substrate-binding protein